jgi:hypothetical protein
MSEELHSIASVAKEIGRFELHFTEVATSIFVRKPLVGLPRLRALGIASAQSIRAFPAPGLGPKRESLLKFAVESDGGWLLAPPDSVNATYWRQLLRTDLPLVVEAPDSPSWVRAFVSGLYSPIVYYLGCAMVTDDLRDYCRRKLLGSDNNLLIVLSSWSRSVQIFGVGNLYDEALDAMSTLRGEVYGYSSTERKRLLRGGSRLLPRSVGG